MKKKITFLLLLVFVFVSFTGEASEDYHVNYTDSRVESNYFAEVYSDEIMKEMFKQYEETGNIGGMQMSSRIFSDWTDDAYNEEERAILSQYADDIVKFEEIRALTEHFNVIMFAAERGSNRDITLKNSAELSEIMYVGEESIHYDTSELEYLVLDEDWMDGSKLRLNPNDFKFMFYITPKHTEENVVIEFYSSVENTYRTERKAMKNILHE